MPIEAPIYHEQPLSPETQNPQYDAILVHGYWMSEPKPRRVKMALRTHFAARAAALAYNGGKGAGKIVIDLGHLWGPDYPTEGSVIAKALETKYHVPHNAIILRENAYGTFGEVKSVLELAKENGWTNVLDVAFGNHHWTIPQIYWSKELWPSRPKHLGVEYRSVESILEEDDRRTFTLLKRFNASRYGRIYPVYEGIKWALMHRPGFKYESLEAKNKKARTKPGHVAPLLHVDKYKLPQDSESKSA